MEKLKLGHVGAGFVSNFHVRALEQVRMVEVAGITSKVGANTLAKIVRDKDMGPAVVYPSVTELANNVDAIAIYVPNFARINHRFCNNREISPRIISNPIFLLFYFTNSSLYEVLELNCLIK